MLDDSRLDNPALAREERRLAERPGDRELAEVAAWVKAAKPSLEAVLNACPEHDTTVEAAAAIADAVDSLGVVRARLDREGWPT